MIYIQKLESRALLSAVAPSNLEQYLVELVNRARANPAAEAMMDGIDLNEGLAAGTISSAAKQPLAINPNLTYSARTHSQWMLDNDIFSHTGAGGTDPGQRMSNAGYSFVGSWTWGENIAWKGSFPSTPDPTLTTADLHKDLFTDLHVPGRGHRLNLMTPSFRELGAGVLSGIFTTQSPTKNYNAVMVTEDFAANSGNAAGDSFLTGVAYTDAAVHDNFYTPGEGIGGAAIQAVRQSDSATFFATTYASGGYSLRLKPGTYNVTISGTGFASPLTISNVTIGSQNVKVDFVPDNAPPTVLSATYDVNAHRAIIEFSEDILPSSLQSADLKIEPIAGGNDLLATGYTYNALTHTVSFDLPSLADGNYRMRISALSISDLSNNNLAADYLSNQFFILAGDANQDRKVDIKDLAIVASNWQGAEKVFTTGDFNRDGKVDARDLGILAINWQQSLPPAASAAILASIVPVGGRPPARVAVSVI